jgi:poly(A) polymerase
VRDLLLGRPPKDYDIATSAHPYEVKRAFRNCWIVGRRFRLAHVKFGQKTIEVATFRRQISEADLDAGPVPPAADAEAETLGPDVEAAVADVEAPDVRTPGRDHLVHRDNEFGTPEEDAFRRDFTVNALFYDIATFSIIDYVGGLEDLESRVIRCIGDPDIRFREDPVRMLRAVVLAARLDFSIDPPILDAIRRHASEIARSAPARLLDEIYKILRSGAAERAFRDLGEGGLLQWIAPELLAVRHETLGRSLASLDRHRRRFEIPPDTLTNAVLIGTLLVPCGYSGRRPPGSETADGGASATRTGDERDRRRSRAHDLRDPRATLGILPVARRDVERLSQALALQRRLRDFSASPRAKRALLHRPAFRDALTWLELHGGDPALTEEWHRLIESSGPVEVTADQRLSQRPRRRRGRRRGPRRHVPME